jgi:hypothetical protein
VLIAGALAPPSAWIVISQSPGLRAGESLGAPAGMAAQAPHARRMEQPVRAARATSDLEGKGWCMAKQAVNDSRRFTCERVAGK